MNQSNVSFPSELARITTSPNQTCLSIKYPNKRIKVIVAIHHNSQSYNF